nr:hypothetical protein GCM10020093_105060 [Planobispora longispora]
MLTVVKSYAEAGIELQMSGISDIITDAPGTDLRWDDAELHNAMVQHFSGHANAPQWKVWMLVASAHTGGYRGIMFDYNDASQRQGAAVFYDAIKGDTPQSQRAQLRTYVHEIGHAFNLLHSWQKNLAVPPQPLGPNGGFADLSWMNYVQNYRPVSGAGGEAAYWAAFPFQFTDSELVHLRHGNYRDVIMGANPFATGAAEISPSCSRSRSRTSRAWPWRSAPRRPSPSASRWSSSSSSAPPTCAVAAPTATCTRTPTSRTSRSPSRPAGRCSTGR